MEQSYELIIISSCPVNRIMISIMSNSSRYTDIVVIISINIAYDAEMKMIRSSSCVIGSMTIMHRSSST